MAVAVLAAGLAHAGAVGAPAASQPATSPPASQPTATLPAAPPANRPARAAPSAGVAAAPPRSRLAVEWVALEAPSLLVALHRSIGPGVGLFIRVARLQHGYFFWTILEGGLVPLGGTLASYVGTGLGVTVPLEPTRRHRLSAGIGVGAGGLATMPRQGCDDCEVGGGPLVLAPTLRYSYVWRSSVTLGVGLRFLVPAERSGARYAAGAVLSFDIGSAPR